MRTAKWIAIGALVVGALLTAGCGSDWWIDDDWDDDYDEPSAWKSVHIYLNVGDQDGRALPDVTVWVAGEAQPNKTESRYQRLGDAFPPNWRGWKYNWSGGPIWFHTRDGDNLRVEILVSRTGYESQRTTFRLGYWDPDEIYVRQTFVMERRVGAAGVEADTVREAPEQPEIISSELVAQ